MDAFDQYLIALVIVTLAARIIWFADYLVFSCWSAPSPRTPRKLWHGVVKKTTASLGGSVDVQERHLRILDQGARRLETMLVGGSIALAAWSQLFVSSEEAADELSGLTLGLLFAGAYALLVSGLLWRAEGQHLTYMGRVTSLHVGYYLIALSLTSIIQDLGLGDCFVATSLAVVSLIAAREVWDVVTLIRTLHAP
ncbi:hypothetical protein ACI8AC_07260 [Geodermatophilus sp. SYSU D00758]